ncbi:isocitrate lyase/PEP mutase family protein [Phanerochaete sordida]|uniref:Isocitrate lyase/PEP mutase family protein n=1 Tax=Phanerochaete sordida TaxID=48140 RepID=A0A9P3G6Z9_9APHY|nr:isocitrate lyase/PEP mutase family protein [Phanerochaete sordida]
MTDASPITYKSDMPKRLRELLQKDGCTICPGIFDGISANLANAAGFDCLYLAGSGASGSVLGEPDLSVITASELANTARMTVGVTSVPIVADADTGFGGPLNVARTIALYEAAGVAGCHIEDQTFPKRCGQLTGKDVVEMEEYLERIRAAVKARRNPDFVIIARTDARNATAFGGEQAGEHAFEEGVKRLKAACAAGADVAFMESPRTRDECVRLVRALHPHPVMINVLPNGLTGNYSTQECTDMGFKLAIYPCTGFIPAAIAMKKAYQNLKEKGTDLEDCQGWQIKDFFEHVGLKQSWAFDKEVSEEVKNEVNPKKYEDLTSQALF